MSRKHIKHLVSGVLENFQDQLEDPCSPLSEPSFEDDKKSREKRTRKRKADIRKQRFASIILESADLWLRELEGESDLPELAIVEVVPHPLADQYLIVIRSDLDSQRVEGLREYLQRKAGWLRSIVANRVQAKTTPLLSVEVLGREELPS